MKTNNLLKKLFLISALVLVCTGVFAQEKQKKIKININKDGKSKIDTVLTFSKDFDKSKLKQILSDLVDEEIDIEKDFDSLLKELEVSVSVLDDGKKIMVKKISEKDGQWTVEETEEFSGDEIKTKSAKAKAYVVTSGDMKIDILEEMDENKFEYLIKADKSDNDEDEYVVVIKTDDGHKEIIKTKKPYSRKKTNVWVSDDSEDVHFFNKGGKNFTIHKSDGKVNVKEGDFMWTTEEGEIHEIKGEKGDVIFITEDGKHEMIKFDGEKKFVMKKSGDIDQAMVDLSFDEESGKYILEYNSESNDPVSIQIFDKNGKQLFKKKIKEFYGKYKDKIELGSKKNKEFKIEIQQGKKKIETEIVF